MASENEQDSILNELQQNWSPEMSTGQTDAIPDGGATAKITNAFVNRAQSSGRKQLGLQFTLLGHDSEPNMNGRQITKYWGLEKVEDIKRLNTVLAALELDVVRQAQDIARVMRDIQNVCCNVTLKTNDPGFPPNVYVNAGARRRDLEQAASGGTTTAAPPKGAF